VSALDEPAPAPPPVAEGAFTHALRGALIAVASLAVAAIITLPVIDLALARVFWKGIPSAGSIADHATLVLAFAAAALASLDKRHISIAGGEGTDRRLRRPWERGLASFGDVVAVSTQACLFWAALSFSLTGFDAASRVWIIPIRAIAAIMPVCLALMAAFTIRSAGLGKERASRFGLNGRQAIASIGLVIGSLLASSSIRNFAEAAALFPGGRAPAFLGALAAAVQAFVGAYGLPLSVLIALALPFGAPIFTVLGGIAAILFVGNGAFLELAPSEAYSLLKGGSISALPLFGIAGIILAESGAGKRFVAVFRELFGWFRGGEAIAAILACAVFSTFTGINGVTIVALGGILSAVLSESGGMSEERSRGLITASGDIGLLIPPSAAVIVYGVNAQFLYGPSENFTIVSLFKGALVPGFLLIAAMCAIGVFMSPKRKLRELPIAAARGFKPGAAFGALRPAALELLVPVAAVALYFTGFASLREIGALSVLYIAIVESLVKRELGFRGLIAALGKAFPIVGGTLMIIAAARGLSFYLIDANLPAAFTTWIQAMVSSKFVFLLLLNLFLIVVGCLMDIFSAILVISPFLIPLGVAFGIPPVQFGVIFIMNLLLGFLTPTVGMNIFLASYTFKKPVPRIVRDVWPFLIVQAAVLLLVTYVPGLSTIFK
jgi:tripartite ATP-independent transporter DctM subunit